jgi:hypothetical protein
MVPAPTSHTRLIANCLVEPYLLAWPVVIAVFSAVTVPDTSLVSDAYFLFVALLFQNLPPFLTSLFCSTPFDRNAALIFMFVLHVMILVKKKGLRVITLVNSKALKDSGPVFMCTNITHTGSESQNELF